MIRRIVAVIAICFLAITGCAQSDYREETATAFQGQVMQVTQAAASGDVTAALSRLNELEVAVKDALARNELTQARHDSILAAIQLVRADLDQAIADIQAAQELQRQQELLRQQQLQQQQGNNGDKDKDKDEDD